MRERLAGSFLILFGRASNDPGSGLWMWLKHRLPGWLDSPHQTDVHYAQANYSKAALSHPTQRQLTQTVSLHALHVIKL